MLRTIKLFTGIFITNLKGIVRRDRGMFRKAHRNSWESAYCKEYEL